MKHAVSYKQVLTVSKCKDNNNIKLKTSKDGNLSLGLLTTLNFFCKIDFHGLFLASMHHL